MTLQEYTEQLLPQYKRSTTWGWGDAVPQEIAQFEWYPGMSGTRQDNNNKTYTFDWTDGAGLHAAAQKAYQDSQRQAAATQGQYTTPQDVLNHFQNLTPGANTDPYYTDAEGYKWAALRPENGEGTGGGFFGMNQGDVKGGYERLLRSDERERPFNEVGALSSYFDNNGIYQQTLKSNRANTWGELIAMLGASVVGMGALGAGVGAAGAAGGAGATGAGAAGSGAFLGEGVASGIGAWDAALAAAPSWTAAGGYAGGAAAANAGGGAGNGAFLGEGASSGVPAWDGAAGSGFSGGGTSAMGAGGSGGAPAGGGTMPPANPYNWQSYLSAENLGNLATSGGGFSSWLGPAASLLGAAAGAQGQENSTTSNRQMDPRMDALFYGDLAPRTQGLLGAQMPSAYAAGGQMLSKGSELLGKSVPTVNPHMVGVADDMSRRTQELLGQNNLAIQGNSVASGGLGGSRQGIAQGTAASKAADYLQGNLANLNFSQFNADQNRLLQQQTLGAGLMSQGLNTQFQPLQNAAQTYSPFTGFGQTTNSSTQGGGWQGALGGALGAAQFGSNAGWW